MQESAPATPILDTQLFRDAFNTSPIGIAVENLDGQPLFVNPAFCRFLGFTEEELRTKHCVDFSPPEDAEKDWALFQQLRAGTIDHYQIEKRYFRRDGSLVWGSLSISLFKSRPSPLVLAMVEDITEKKTAEETLFRHAAIVESSEDAIASGTLDGIIVSWNAGAQHMYGYTEAEAVGKPITILVPPELVDEENKILATLKMGGRIEQLETIRVTKTGKKINVSLSISPIKDSSGRIVGVSGIARDITERKRTEEALHESEERLRLAVQAGKMFAYSWDAATDVIERSGESAEILGVKSDQAATGAAISAMVHPDDRQRLEAALSNLNVENPTLQIAYRIVRPDREVKWLERNSRAYFDAQGKLTRIVGMIADVTERKRSEERLREYERAIENAEEMIAVVDREYRYLIANRQFLKLRNKTREQVVGCFAHEVLKEGVFEAEVKPRLDECFKGKVVRYEMKYTYPELGERDVLVSYFPIEGAIGIDRAVCILQDITERKRAEQEFSKANERLRLALEAGSAGGWDFDLRTGKNVWFGKAHAQLGMTHDATLGSVAEFWARVHEDDRARLEHALQISNEKHDEFAEDFRVVWRDGTTHWLRSRGRHYYSANGEPERMLGICIDITESKRAEEAVKESETRFRLVADTAPVMIWMSGVDKKPTYFNQLWLDFTGFSETDLQNRFAEIVHPDDYHQCNEVYCQGFDQRQPFRKECRLRTHDGQYRWMLDIGVPRFHKDGSFAGYIGSCIDVTDSKLAEEALTNISRNLIEAQEQERARIGRELHDDINQRLAMLALELEQLQANPSEVQTRLPELRKQTTELSNDVQALSHELHSSKLEYLGVVSGIKSWCNEFGERQKMEIDFKSDASSVLPLEVGVCLFRVLQEALHNAVKHSEVRRVEVRLREEAGEIHLIVSDLGKGFDIDAATQGRGLGLTSMQERVRLLNGSFEIQSKPMGGTTIHVRIPFGSEHGTRRAAG